MAHGQTCVGHSLQRSIADPTGQRSRGGPAPTLGDEARLGIDDGRCAAKLDGHRRQCLFGTRPLLALEGVRLKAPICIEGENAKGTPNDANRLTIQKFNKQVGHAYASTSEAGNWVTTRIVLHPLER